MASAKQHKRVKWPYLLLIKQKNRFRRTLFQRQFRKISRRSYDEIRKRKLIIRRKKMYLITIMFVISNIPRERSVWCRPRTDAWFRLAHEHFTDSEWYENFQISKQTFLFVVAAVELDIKWKTTIFREAVSVHRRVAITIYYLVSTAEYRTIANLFGVSRSFVCNCVKDVCKAIVSKLQSRFISLPTANELQVITDAYKIKWGFPACWGAINGTHIPIIAPLENHTDYVNRKGYHSIVMQAVVDVNYLFRDIVVGWPGSVHDARILNNSNIFRLAEGKELGPANTTVNVGTKAIPSVLLGDPAYPLMSWLLKPYPQNANTTGEEKRFNYRLSRARVTVENTFGRWKGRFRRFLKRIDMKVETLVTVVAASCILNNICEINKEDVLADWLCETNQAGAEFPQPVRLVGEAAHDNDDAVSIRDYLADYVMTNEGSAVGTG